LGTHRRRLLIFSLASFLVIFARDPVKTKILPASFLRYFWTFAMLAIGPLGVYFFVRSLISKSYPAFVGAMFYIFNLVTVQTFFTPFETFVSFYGFLPWLLLFATSYLKTGNQIKIIATICKHPLNEK